MLAVRIIPSLLVRGRQLIKGQQFKSWRSVGVAIQAAKVHAMRGVDELCILDIGATPEGRGPDLGMIEELTRDCFTPISVGGGVRSLGDIDALLRAGADKVVINTALFEVPGLLAEASARYGCQAFVAAIDVKGGMLAFRCGEYTLAADTPASMARMVEDQGAGEILLTSIDREGMMCGFDLDLISKVSAAVNIPVVANGGCSTYSDMLCALAGGASAVSAGSLFQFTDCTPAGAAAYLEKNGIEVRHDRAA